MVHIQYDLKNQALAGNKDSPMDPDSTRNLRNAVWKSVWVLNVSFFLLFAAFDGLNALQSSIYRDQRMGTVCQSVATGTAIVSCVITPTLVINKLGVRTTLSICMLGYV